MRSTDGSRFVDRDDILKRVTSSERQDLQSSRIEKAVSPLASQRLSSGFLMLIRALHIQSSVWRLDMSTSASLSATENTPNQCPSPPRPRDPNHIPNTGFDEESTYVLTLTTNREFHQRINDLRKQYFPPQLNKIGAHITLFHALPGSQLPTIIADLLDLASTQSSFSIKIIEPLKMSHGVALNAKNQEAHRLWNSLMQKWGPAGADFLSKQDQSFRAHYTIQNKAEKDVAQKAWEEVKDRFKSDEGEAIGFTLYRYMKGGYWRYQRTIDFTKSVPPAMSSNDFPTLGGVAS